MSAENFSPLLLLLSLIAPLVVGILVLAWGKRILRSGDWLAGLALVGTLGCFIYVLVESLQTGFRPESWITNWIGSRHAAYSLVQIGVLKDEINLAIGIWLCLLALLSITHRPLIVRESHPERFYASAAIATSGALLSWIALTPWLAFGGIGIATLGGFLSLGSRWETDNDATLSVRFIRERVCGLILMVLGTSALLNAGHPVSWSPGAGASVAAVTDPAGLWCLIVGIVIFFQPFPLVSWAVQSAQGAPFTRILFPQVFTGLAAFALLTRIEPLMRASQVSEIFGWAMYASAMLTALTGLFQSDWRLSVSTWIATAFTLSAAVLGFAGADAALSILISTTAVGFVMPFLGGALELGGQTTSSNKKRASWIKFATYTAAASGSGMVGFMACGGSIRWLIQGLEDPGMLIAFGSGLLLSGILVWRTAWQITGIKTTSQVPWPVIAVSFLILIFSLGIFWSGSLTGSALPPEMDIQVQPFQRAYFEKSSQALSGDSLITASWVHWGVLLLAIFAAYWTTARQDGFQNFSRRFPRFSSFVGQGYKVDALAGYFLRGLIRSGRGLQRWMDEKLWYQGLPRVIYQGAIRMGDAFSKMDGSLVRWLNGAVRVSVEVPAKVLQLIQSGDVQWYVFFAVGMGFAILLHYMRF